MKRLLLLTAFLLAACTQTSDVTQTVNVTIESGDATRKADVVAAAIRVIERRLEALDESLLTHSETMTDAGASITLGASNTEAMGIVLEDMQEPFTFDIMLEAPEEGADLVIMGQGGFNKTGIDQTMLEWTSVSEQEDTSATMTISLTQAGRTALEKLYAENSGKVIGMFVRGRLISKLIADGSLKGQIEIANIPSADIAKTVSDDINVGISATFTPAP